MKHIRNNAVVAFIFIGSMSASVTAAFSGDDGLYEKQIDPNAAFIRVVMPGSQNASIMGKSVTVLDDGVSAYYSVEPGAIPVSTGIGDTTINVSAGKFYSVVPSKGKPVSVEDDLNTNPAKAILSLYNLGDDSDVDVFVPQAKTEAIKDVGSGNSKSVALKAPLTLDLVVRSNGKDVAKIDQVEFKRLSGVSVIVTGSGDAMKAVALANKIAK
jgi:alginate O-acetyltransferase complex protein AlgF